MIMKTMSNKNIKLRKLKSSDKFILAKLLNNRKIWNNLSNRIPYPYGVKDAEKFIEFVNDEDKENIFAIEYFNNFCGVIGLTLQVDIHKHSAELGYWLGEIYWKKGIITEAIKLITKYGFNELNLSRIYARVFENNIASMRALEKNGYSKEGILIKAVLKNGVLLDEHRYFILRN